MPGVRLGCGLETAILRFMHSSMQKGKYTTYLYRNSRVMLPDLQVEHAKRSHFPVQVVAMLSTAPGRAPVLHLKFSKMAYASLDSLIRHEATIRLTEMTIYNCVRHRRRYLGAEGPNFDRSDRRAAIHPRD